MKRMMIFLFLILIVTSLAAQEQLPTDFPDKKFHAGRREAMRNIMPDNSVAVVFSYPEKVYSLDNNYNYHQNPDLYYFTGYRDPEGVLLIFKEKQVAGEIAFNELFFIRDRDARQEQYTGVRFDCESAEKQLGIQLVRFNSEFKSADIDFSAFSKVLYDNLPEDTGGDALSELIKTFMDKADIKHVVSKDLVQAYVIISEYATPSNLGFIIDFLKSSMDKTEDNAFRTNTFIQELVNKPDSATLAVVKTKIKDNLPASMEYDRLISSLREIKTAEEIELLRKSAFITAVSHNEVMKAINPGISEMEISGIFEFIHKKYGAEEEGYTPIIASGTNGCILHYSDNNVVHVNNQLVLMDVGCEYHGYSADITRTVPAGGKFTPEQRLVYEVAYNAEQEVIGLCKEGTPVGSMDEKALDVIASGLLKLGIIKESQEVLLYYLHGCAHPIGLDVHDKNISPVLKENMVYAIEPGIYIPEGSPCDPKWWNIAVRIEDDVLIRKDDCEVLTATTPGKAEEVEKMVAQESVFDKLDLPELK